MKTRFILLISLLWTLIGCSDSDTATLSVSKSKFENVSASGETLSVDISCDASWTVTSNKQWCIPSTQKGENDGELILSIHPNLESASRTATVTIISHKASKTIQIAQNGAANTVEEYHYELPIIFHVLYKEKSVPLQYVSQSRLSDILKVVNALYKDATESVNMNLTFTLATKDPDGKELSVPGVEYQEWPDDYPIDCDKFMEDDITEDGVGYVRYLWDPNQYINVMVYNFSEEAGSNTYTLGISHLPFSTTGSTFLKGTNATSQSYLSLSNLAFPYCVSINSLFINEQSNDEKYTSADVTVTLAHELGHYLGLHHVFSESDDGTCKDTDYCEDTPSYDKNAYNIDYQWATAGNVPNDNLFAYLVKRENCNGAKFISYNIMDYSVSYSNRFTADQRTRIRHVLNYSPLIPGPKKGDINTRSLSEGPLNLPILTIK